MGTLAIISLIFILAIIAIVYYFKCTPEGRKQDVGGDLSEAKLQNKLLDSIEETRKVQGELHERVESLRK